MNAVKWASCGRRASTDEALKAVDHLLDRARQVVLEVAQTNGDVHAVELDLDQILKGEGLVLIAVADQHIEVGVDHRSLVAGGELEGDALDAVVLVRLLLDLRVRRRVEELGPHALAAEGPVFLDQVADARDEGGEQRVGLAREVAADQQGLVEPVQQTPRDRGDAVFPLRGEVDAHTAQRRGEPIHG